MVKAELLTDGHPDAVERYILDPNWVFQEKHNGDRRLVEKQGLSVVDYNRNGVNGKGLSPAIIDALRKHPLPLMVGDAEYVPATDQLFVFDALAFGDEMVIGKPYSYREASYHSQFDGFNYHIVPVASARTPEAKRALIAHLRSIRAEGFVAKDLRAIYRPGGRFNLRFKFWKTLDAVVIGDSKERDDKGMLKDSVRVGLFDSKGILHDICGATKKAQYVLRPGDVVELKYLYGTGTLDVVQPSILNQRFDKAPQECLLDQIVVNKNWSKWGKR
jgi:ATP-dependent DNA ligase